VDIIRTVYYIHGAELMKLLDVLRVRLTELHAAHQNLPPVIRTLRLKETIRKPYTKNERNLTMWFVHWCCVVF